MSNKIFFNVHLFRVPLSWTCSVQMKSSITFIQGNRCIKREKDIFKFCCEVKRLKECALLFSKQNILLFTTPSFFFDLDMVLLYGTFVVRDGEALTKGKHLRKSVYILIPRIIRPL